MEIYEVVCEMKNYWFSLHVLALFWYICYVVYILFKSARVAHKSVEKVCSTSITVKLKRLLCLYILKSVVCNALRCFCFCLCCVYMYMFVLSMHKALDSWWLFRLNRRHLNKSQPIFMLYYSYVIYDDSLIY